MKYPKIIAEIERTQWAITSEALNGILKAVEHGLTSEDYELFHKSEALSDFDANKPTIIDGRGLIVINGPIIPRATALSKSSGIVSIDKLAADFKALEADKSVKEIRFLIDSPGGSITGISDFAKLIRASRKPTVAFIAGEAASAAYWIASAADRIVSTDTGLAGSIGVILRVGMSGDREIISSQSPNKRPNINTKEGRAVVQSLVNELADVFVGVVAENRGVSTDTVLDKFGRGGMLVASQALAVGMIDEISTLDEFMSGEKEYDKEHKIEAQEPRRDRSEIQTLIFKKTNFPTSASAAKWARDHDFKSSPIVEKPDTWHIRQNDPGKYGSFRTGSPIAPGVTPVYGILRRQGAIAIDDKLNTNNPAKIAGRKGAAMQTLAELLAENPAAKIEFEAQLRAQYSAGETAGAEKLRAENKRIATLLRVESYPKKFREKIVMVLDGTKTIESLELLADHYDMMIEEKKSDEAKVESEKQPDVGKIVDQTKLSTDGVLRNEADVLAFWGQSTDTGIEVA